MQPDTRKSEGSCSLELSVSVLAQPFINCLKSPNRLDLRVFMPDKQKGLSLRFHGFLLLLLLICFSPSCLRLALWKDSHISFSSFLFSRVGWKVFDTEQEA